MAIDTDARDLLRAKFLERFAPTPMSAEVFETAVKMDALHFEMAHELDALLAAERKRCEDVCIEFEFRLKLQLPSEAAMMVAAGAHECATAIGKLK